MSRKHSFERVCLIIITLSLIPAFPLSARLVGNRRIPSPSSAEQAFPGLAFSATTDRYLLVWEEGTGGSRAVRGALLDRFGAVIGSSFEISLSTDTGEKFAADVAWKEDIDQFLVVWEQATSVSNHDIASRLVSSSGSLGTRTFVENDAEDQRAPRVAADSGATGRFFVVWQDARVTPAGIFGRFLNGDGTLDPSGRNSLASNGKTPDIAQNSLSEGWELVYDRDAANNTAGIFSVALTAGGAAGVERRLSPAPNDPTHPQPDPGLPRITFNAGAPFGGRYLAAWQASASTGFVWSHQINSDGTLFEFNKGASEPDALYPSAAASTVAGHPDRALILWVRHSANELNGAFATGVSVPAGSTVLSYYHPVQWPGLPGGANSSGAGTDASYNRNHLEYLVAWAYDVGGRHNIAVRLIQSSYDTAQSDYLIPGMGPSSLAVFRPSTQMWYWRSLDGDQTGQTSNPYGLSTDIPLRGCYLWGVGYANVTVFRPSTGYWYASNNNDGFNNSSIPFGTTGDIPVIGDFDGNGAGEYAVFRPSSGTWFIDNTWAPNSVWKSVAFGTAGDTPVSADYDGDGNTDVAVYRPSTGFWYITLDLSGVVQFQSQFGAFGDIPAPADYDGDGKTDVAVFRPSAGAWYVKKSSGGEFSVQFGTADDVPVPTDYDGDGVADVAVFRPSNGTWYFLLSSGGQVSVQFGTAGDIPLTRFPAF
jgi:hypothetical protein